MKTISFLSIIFLFFLVLPLAAQDTTSTVSSIQEIIMKQQGQYDSLTIALQQSVKTLNDTLSRFRETFEFPISALNADSIDRLTAPEDIELTPPHDVNDILLIADRLKMRNNSINQIVRIISDEKNYLGSSIRSYKALKELRKNELEAADNRNKETEIWGRKKFFRGILIGFVFGGLVGIIAE